MVNFRTIYFYFFNLKYKFWVRYGKNRFRHFQLFEVAQFFFFFLKGLGWHNCDHSNKKNDLRIFEI